MVSPIRSTLCPLGANPPFPPPPVQNSPPCMHGALGSAAAVLPQLCSHAFSPCIEDKGRLLPPPPSPGPFGAVGLSANRRAALLLSLPITPKRELAAHSMSMPGGGVENGAQLLSCSMRDPQCPPHPIPSPAALYCTAHCPGGVPWSTAGLGYGVPMPSPHPPRVPFPSVRVAGGAVGNPPLCRSTALGLSLLHHSSTLTYFWLLSVCAPMWAPNLHGDFIADLV